MSGMPWCCGTAQCWHDQLYDLLSLWYQRAAFFMVNGYLMFSRDSQPYAYAFRKIRNLLIPVIGFNILILVPVRDHQTQICKSHYPVPEKSFPSRLSDALLVFWFSDAAHTWSCRCYTGLCKAVRLPCPSSVCFLLFAVSASVFCPCRKAIVWNSMFPQTLRLWTWLLFFLFGGLCAVGEERKSMLFMHMPLWLHGSLVVLLAVINNFCIKKNRSLSDSQQTGWPVLW